MSYLQDKSIFTSRWKKDSKKSFRLFYFLKIFCILLKGGNTTYRFKGVRRGYFNFMHIVLVFKSDYSFGTRVLVEILKESHIDQVKLLVQAFKYKEAFEFIKKISEPSQFLYEGADLRVHPDLVLFEDLL